jgi:hypothetical protein
MEDNNLLSDNQHGFRECRSTMTVHVAMQKDWLLNTEKEAKTGLLIWDLSVAFNTLDTLLPCQKLAVYGFDNKTCHF